MKGFGIRLVFSLDEMDRKKDTFVPGTKPERTKSILKPFFFQIFLWKVGKDMILVAPNYLLSVFCLKLLTHRSSGLYEIKRYFSRMLLWPPAWDFLIQKQF